MLSGPGMNGAMSVRDAVQPADRKGTCLQPMMLVFDNECPMPPGNVKHSIEKGSRKGRFGIASSRRSQVSGSVLACVARWLSVTANETHTLLGSQSG